MIARLVLVLLLLLLFTPACHRTAQRSTITFKYEVTPQPPRVGANTIELELRDRNEQAVSGARVELEGNMSHAGMSPVTIPAKEIEPGKYRGTLQLTMAGDWIVSVNVTLSDGERLKHQINLDGVRSN